jgi:hypothetical protein
VTHTGEWGGAQRLLLGKTEEKRLLGTTRRRFEDNIIINLKRNKKGEWNGLIWLRIRGSSWFL